MRSSTLAGLSAAVAYLAACSNDEPTAPRPVPVATIEVTPSADTLTAIAQTLQLTATARDSNGSVIPGIPFVWSSSDPDVAEVVAGTGLATARAAGPVTVTASAGGRAGEARLVVDQVVATIELDPAHWSPRWEGDRIQYTAAAKDANGHNVPGVTFSWLSGDSDIARVDGAGVVTAVAQGTTTVTATGADSTGEAAITVPEFGDVLDGLVYTIWFARSDSTPALLVDGSIQTPKIWDEPPAEPVWDRANVSKFQWRGDRIGLLTDVVGGAGHLRVRDRVGEWEKLADGNAVDFALSGELIALVKSDGSLLAKESIQGPWTTLSSAGVRDWQVAGGRYFGLVDGTGEFFAKDGIHGPWWLLAETGVKNFQLTSGGRIGLLSEDGEFKVKDGVTGPWTVLVTGGAAIGAASFRLSGNRIAVQFTDGSFQVKDGIDGPWTVLETETLQQYALAGDVIAVLRSDGVFRAKEGIHGEWTVLASTGVREIQLQGNLIGVLSHTGLLSVKQGIHGTWMSADKTYSGAISQFRLLVDVPVPPARITPQQYSGKQADCAADLGGVPCVSPWEAGLVPVYGRYCGLGIPTDEHWEAAEDLGPIDSLDVLCRHHDYALGWYPEASSALVYCEIVKYGLHFSRLTQNGVLLTHGGDSQANWDAAWGSLMPNLKGAVDAYFSWLTTCPLNGFMEATASQN